MAAAAERLATWGTIYRWFAAWRDDGRFERINHALVIADRERVGRDASPTAAIIDSQSAKTTEAGGPRGYDAGKKINGLKRHALVDTDGRGLVLEPHPASIQDRDGGGPLLHVSRRIFPFIERVFADSGYTGEKVATATLIAVEIVRKNPDQVGFTLGVGSLSGSSRGSGAIDGWQKTSRLPSTPHVPSSTPHPSCCSCDGSLVLMTFETDSEAAAGDVAIHPRQTGLSRSCEHNSDGASDVIRRASDQRALARPVCLPEACSSLA